MPTVPREAIAPCDAGCWEPTAAVGADGVVYATSAEQVIWALHPGAQELRRIEAPPAAVADAFRGDVTVDVGPDGALYYSTLTVSEVASGVRSRAIEVHRSADGGTTWESVFLGTGDDVPSNPSDMALAADRQWLFFDEDTTYITFQRPLGVLVAFTSEVVMATAPLGTLDFSDWQPISPAETRASAKINGRGVATDEGALVPMWTPGPMNPDSWGFYLTQVTPDRVAYHDVSQGNTGAWFPAVTALDDGRLVAAWASNDNLWTAEAAAAASWSEPVQAGQNLVTSPWLVNLGDRAGIVWHQAEGDGTTLHLTVGTPGNWSQPFQLATGITGQFGRASNTDMAHAASANGVMATVWSSQDGDGMHVWVMDDWDALA